MLSVATCFQSSCGHRLARRPRQADQRLEALLAAPARCILSPSVRAAHAFGRCHGRRPRPAREPRRRGAVGTRRAVRVRAGGCLADGVPRDLNDAELLLAQRRSRREVAARRSARATHPRLARRCCCGRSEAGRRSDLLQDRGRFVPGRRPRRAFRAHRRPDVEGCGERSPNAGGVPQPPPPGVSTVTTWSAGRSSLSSPSAGIGFPVEQVCAAGAGTRLRSCRAGPWRRPIGEERERCRLEHALRALDAVAAAVVRRRRRCRSAA